MTPFETLIRGHLSVRPTLMTKHLQTKYMTKPFVPNKILYRSKTLIQSARLRTAYNQLLAVLL